MVLSLEQYRSNSLLGKIGTIKDILTKRIERQRKKSIGVALENGDIILDHLIIEILSQLPVKTLLQFKSVCKSWYAMIKSSHFIAKHLRNYYDKVGNWRDCLIVQYARKGTWDLNECELLIDNKKNRVLFCQEIKAPIKNTFLWGPCNGIYFRWAIVYDTCQKRSMWNPALNELKILPDIMWKPNLPLDSTKIHEICGFGYDSKTKDYKVIVILGYKDMRDEGSRFADNPMSILIYSLKTNSWRH